MHPKFYWLQVRASCPRSYLEQLHMGCSSSSPAAAETKASGGRIDIDISKLEKAKQNGENGEVPHSQRLTSSGYLSDLQSDRAAFTHAFVHNHVGKNASQELTKTYDVEQASVLGRGACGSVVVVKHRTTGELYAMKVISIDTVGGSLEELKQEIELQKRLDHPNICKIFESFEDKTTNELYIIMEICTGGSLVSRMKTHRHGYGERAAATLLEKMLSSVIYCHHHGVVHRDIKLDNFIYEHEGESCSSRHTSLPPVHRSSLFSHLTRTFSHLSSLTVSPLFSPLLPSSPEPSPPLP